MKLHLLKISEDFAEDVFTGVKTFEYRFNDRDFKEGDLIKFTEVETGDVIDNAPLYEITYLLNHDMFNELHKDWVIFSIEPFHNSGVIE